MAQNASSTLHSALIGCALLALGGCERAEDQTGEGIVNAMDPQVARALNDPLMIDPDLSHRNEANAAITIGHDHALPSFTGTDETASRARETARLQLLEEGPMDDLPEPGQDESLVSLAEVWDVPGVLATLGAPEGCTSDIAGDFTYAADLPGAAQVMPHGMVRVAAAADSETCTMRLVRYATPAASEDVLEYHYNVAKRAGLEPQHFAEPESIVKSDRRGERLEVHARGASGNLTYVDLVYWKRL